MSSFQIHDLDTPAGSSHEIGAVVTNIDLENLTDADFQQLREALYRRVVVLIPNQGQLTPKAQYELTRRFDPVSTSYGHGQTLDAKKSILHPDLKTIPSQPQVQVIGNGHVSHYEGLDNIILKHPHHKTFHKSIVPAEEDLDFTRFYRWHIDAALYELNPPMVTSLLAVKVPGGRTQTVRYDDGSGDELVVPLGTTAFVSGEKMYDLLSEEDKEFARTARIEYAPHPYIWMSGAKSYSTGLGLFSDDNELPASSLPPINKDGIQIIPLVWKNPVTGKLALQIHPSAIRALHPINSDPITDLKSVREIVYRLQRPGIAPALVYAHDWKEGDLVLFNNRGCLHSVVGAFDQNEVRLFRQCNMAGSCPVEGSDEWANVWKGKVPTPISVL